MCLAALCALLACGGERQAVAPVVAVEAEVPPSVRCSVAAPGLLSPTQRQLFRERSLLAGPAWVGGIILWEELAVEGVWLARVRTAAPAREVFRGPAYRWLSEPWDGVCIGDCRATRVWEADGFVYLAAVAVLPPEHHRWSHCPSLSPEELERSRLGATESTVRLFAEGMVVQDGASAPQTLRWADLEMEATDHAFQEANQTAGGSTLVPGVLPLDAVRVSDERSLLAQLESRLALWERGVLAADDSTSALDREAIYQLAKTLLAVHGGGWGAPAAVRALSRIDAFGPAMIGVDWVFRDPATIILSQEDQQYLRQVQRYATFRSGSPSFVASVVRDGVGTARDGEAILAMLSDIAPENFLYYMIIEGAWGWYEGRPHSAVRPASATVPWSMLIESMVGLLTWNEEDLAPIFVVVEAAEATSGVAMHSTGVAVTWRRPSTARERGPRRPFTVVGAQMDGRYALDVHIRVPAVTGDVRVTVWLGEEQGRSLIVEGHVEEASGERLFVLTTSSRVAGRTIRWAEVARHLVPPLGNIRRERFPPDPLWVRLSHEEATAVLDAAPPSVRAYCSLEEQRAPEASTGVPRPEITPGERFIRCDGSVERPVIRRTAVNLLAPLLFGPPR